MVEISSLPHTLATQSQKNNPAAAHVVTPDYLFFCKRAAPPPRTGEGSGALSKSLSLYLRSLVLLPDDVSHGYPSIHLLPPTHFGFFPRTLAALF